MTGIGKFLNRAHRWRDELEALELELLEPDTRRDANRLRTLVRDDFIEFGSSGRVYEKAMLIEMLAKEEQGKVLIRDFAVRELAGEVALVTYRTVGTSGQEARRSSVWVKEDPGWKLVFHQGTRIPNSWGPVG